jgi:GTP-binding protein
LINALVKRQVARTSAAPGKTRLANVYRVQRGSMTPRYLVDLPGYGYARAPKTSSGASRPSTSLGPTLSQSKGRRGSRRGAREEASLEFGALVETYVNRPGSRAVLLLVDARHPGLESDLEAARWFRSQPCAVGVVATKVDKLTRAERERHARELETLFQVPVALVSAHTGEGLDDLWKMIASLPKPTVA